MESQGSSCPSARLCSRGSKCRIWNKFGVNAMYFASLLELGDNFAILVGDDSEQNIDFNLLVFTRKMFIYIESFVCKWGESFAVGDKIIQERYY